MCWTNGLIDDLHAWGGKYYLIFIFLAFEFEIYYILLVLNIYYTHLDRDDLFWLSASICGLIRWTDGLIDHLHAW